MLTACGLVARFGAAETSEPGTPLRVSPQIRLRCLATRAAVPAIYVVVIRSLRWLAGPGWSGRFVTFPGGSLALLIATHVEAGPASARRLAAAMPSGSFGTLAFLTVFRHSGARLGLAGATLAGYAAALLTLLTIETTLDGVRALRRRHPQLLVVEWTALGQRFQDGLAAGRRLPWWRLDPALWAWPIPVGDRRIATRRFAPGLECLAG
ncbi:MAG: hypothetical protein U0794_02685 [Isosphaeraceae bacterium]